MSPDDRRAALIEVVTALLLRNGSAVTTREIAEAAGIAEGTIFRVFPDKESLFAAAVEQYLQPDELRERIRAIDPSLPLDEKVHNLIALMLDRFEGVIRMMHALGQHGRPRENTWPFAEPIAALLEPDRARLAIPPERVAHYIRLLAFSSAIPQFTRDMGFTVDELTDLVLGGIARAVPTASTPEPLPQRG